MRKARWRAVAESTAGPWFGWRAVHREACPRSRCRGPFADRPWPDPGSTLLPWFHRHGLASQSPDKVGETREKGSHARWALGPAANLSLEGTRREPANDDAAEQRSGLTFQARW